MALGHPGLQITLPHSIVTKNFQIKAPSILRTIQHFSLRAQLQRQRQLYLQVPQPVSNENLDMKQVSYFITFDYLNLDISMILSWRSEHEKAWRKRFWTTNRKTAFLHRYYVDSYEYASSGDVCTLEFDCSGWNRFRRCKKSPIHISAVLTLSNVFCLHIWISRCKPLVLQVTVKIVGIERRPTPVYWMHCQLNL